MTKTLKIEELTAKKLYKTAAPELKEILEQSFGKEFFSEELTDIIKNYSDVCKKLNTKELTEKDFKQFGDDAKKMLAFHQIKNIENLFNQGWIKDWSNKSQYKYYPYFEVLSCGVLRCCRVSYVSVCFLGSVAFFKDEKTAKFVGQTFIDIYKELM